MEKHGFILSIDQGTSGTRSSLVDSSGVIVGSAYQEITQYFPSPGWVEHDPEELFQSVLETIENLLDEFEVAPENIRSIGITNQRETTLIWDRRTGKPIYNAIEKLNHRRVKLNKIPYKIVPGATAGIAGLAYAGIPATHRDFNTSITFISAYGAGGEKPETIDWASFSKTSQLIVIYMGLERINWVCSELIKRGRDRYENIAVISNATKQNQKILISTLSNCLQDFDKNMIDSPALLVIGKNVLLSPILNWYSTNKRNISFLKQNKKDHEQYNFV